MIIVGGLLEKDGKFLLVQEAKKSCYRKWNLPAGHLEPNESLQDGAKREVFEETGCKVELKDIVQIGSMKVPEEPFVNLVFSTEIIEENINFDKNEILDVKWFSYEEILDMKEDLRNYDFLVGSIENLKNGIKCGMEIIRNL